MNVLPGWTLLKKDLEDLSTEQVEDTKSFFKILAVLLALGPVFTMDVPSSYLGMVMFGYHAGDVHNVNDSSGLLDNCSHWVLVWSGSLKYICGTLFFPIYIWLVFSYLRRRIPRMFVRLFSGIVLYLLGNLFLIAVDLIGHRLLDNHAASSDEVASLCMFDIVEVLHTIWICTGHSCCHPAFYLVLVLSL